MNGDIGIIVIIIVYQFLICFIQLFWISEFLIEIIKLLIKLGNDTFLISIRHTGKGIDIDRICQSE